MASYAGDKAEILGRLRKIEGQLRGVQRMVEEDKYCVDVLTQLSSIMAATEKVGLLILQNHIRGCVRDALTRPEQDSEPVIRELVEVVERFAKA